MASRKLAVIEAQNVALGQGGSILIDQSTTDQDAVCLNGIFIAIQFIEDTVFGTLTGETSQLFVSSGQTSTTVDANAGAAATAVTFPAGMTIYGRWTTINLASGACIAYVG